MAKHVNKVALITGSSSGIGLGMAERFASQGYGLMLHGIEDSASVKDTLERLASISKNRVEYLQADVSVADECRRLVNETENAFGKIDVLINNAGIQFTSRVEDFPEDKWSKIIDINLSSAFHTSKAALPGMYNRKWGRLIHTASVHGLVASTNKAAYVSAKHGLIGLSKVIALEAAGTGVTSNCICPGWVLTPLVEAQIHARAEQEGISYEDAKRRLVGEKQPSGETAAAQSIGGLATFLASEDGDQITGASYNIDGGWVAQ